MTGRLVLLGLLEQTELRERQEFKVTLEPLARLESKVTMELLELRGLRE
jgi:hypothetical protein